MALLAAASLAAAPPASAWASPELGAPQAARGADIEERLGRAIRKDLPFTDMDGRRVTLEGAFDGKRPVLLVLAYYRCPLLCGLVLRGVAGGLRELDWRLGEQYRALAVSFDPRDTPEAAAKKRASTLAALAPDAAREGAFPFLVGGEVEARALADDLGFRYAYDPATDQYAHPAAAFVLTPDGRISRYLYGVELSPLDLRLALLEASRGEIGTLVDRVLMTCYRYDPATRRYGAYVTGFLRLGGGVIAAAVSTMVAAFLWCERRRRRVEGAT
jgi:protein SCO1/2